MAKVKIKRNDEVLVIAGKDRGVSGKVLRVLPREGKAVVERINMVKRHTRPNPNRQIQGGVLEREAPIQLSNLKLICPQCGKPTRVGTEHLEDGTAVRTCKRCGASLG